MLHRVHHQFCYSTTAKHFNHVDFKSNARTNINIMEMGETGPSILFKAIVSLKSPCLETGIMQRSTRFRLVYHAPTNPTSRQAMITLPISSPSLAEEFGFFPLMTFPDAEAQ